MLPIHNINTSVEITSIEDLQTATEENPDLQMLQRYIIMERPLTKEAVKPGVEEYRPIRHELVMIDSVAMKGKCIIKPCLLQSRS